MALKKKERKGKKCHWCSLHADTEIAVMTTDNEYLTVRNASEHTTTGLNLRIEVILAHWVGSYILENMNINF